MKIIKLKKATVLITTSLCSFFYFVTQAQIMPPPVCFNQLLNTSINNVGTFPLHFCSADFNNDGKPDVVTANNSSNNLSLLLGTGNGSFSPATTISGLNSPWAICSADFNSDGNADLAVTNPSAGAMQVLLGSGAGSFATPVTYNVGANSYQSIKAADFNGDGNPDVVISRSVTVAVLLGSSSGTFSAAQYFSVGNIAVPVCTGDFNKDGKQDIAVGNNGSNNVSVLMGLGTGSFAAAVNYSVGSSPYGMNVADYNGDGNLDLTVCNYGGGNVSVLLGSASGTFAQSAVMATGAQPGASTAADFNLDGNIDLAVANGNTKNLSIFMGNGSGGFGVKTDYLSFDNLNDVLAIDMNSDGVKDLVCTSYSGNRVSVYINSGNGTMLTSTQFGISNIPFAMTMADFNADGKQDFATCNYYSGDVSIVSAAGGANFSVTATYSAGTFPRAITSGDFNNDGKPDLAVCHYTTNSISILINTPSGTFTNAPSVSTGSNPISLVCADFNQDGNADLAVADFNSQGIRVLFGNGTGAFGGATTYSTNGGAYYLSCSDFNNDGKPDLAYVSGMGVTGLLMCGTGGVFTTGASYTVGTTPMYLIAGDLNNDSRSDLVVSNFNSNSISVLMGSGAGTFTTVTNYSVGTSPQALTMGDYNMDGLQDIGVTYMSVFNSSLSVLPGIGNGVFSPATTFTIGITPRMMITSDFNADGKPDIAVLNSDENKLNLLLNGIPSLTINANNTVCLGNSITLRAAGAVTYTWSNNSSTSPVISVNPTSSNVYTVTGKSLGGCVATAVKTINVVSLPLPTITVNSGSVCAGNSFTILASGANSYTYQGGNNIVTPATSNGYSVIGTSTLTGCVSAAAISSVNVVQRPVITAASGTVCSGQSFTIVPSGANSYTFSSGSAVVSPVVNSTYSINGIGNGGCISQLPAIVNVSVISLPVLTVANATICSGQSYTISANGALTYSYSSGSPVISPAITTNYTVYGTNAFGCNSNGAVATISVRSLPVISVAGGVLCAGKSFTLQPQGALTYTYSSGPVVSPVSNTSYSVTGTDSFGCVSSQAAVCTITVNPLPVFTISGGNAVCAGSQIGQLASGNASSYLWSNGASGNYVVLSPSVSSNYTVTGTDNNGCQSTVTKLITVNSLPVITVNSGSVCAGQSYVLSPSGALSYSYSSGSAIVSPSITSTYIVYGTNANACTGSASSTVSVIQLPTLNIATSSSLICANETVTLSASGANTYSWSQGANTGVIVVNPASTTVYTVTGYNGNCAATSTLVQNVNACTGIAKNNLDLPQINVYPNPSTGIFTFECEPGCKLKMYNLTGQLILEKTVSESTNIVDLSNLASGIYYMQLSYTNGTVVVKLAKE